MINSGRPGPAFSEGPGETAQQFVHVEHARAHSAPNDAIVIADAHFLFNAEFKRSGLDLILQKDGHEVVVPDYFRGDKRATLASPDGARLTGDIINALAGSVELAQAGSAVAAVHQVIGHVTKLVGSATVIRNGVSIILNMGDNVEKGDAVTSGSDSTLGITFIDGTVFGLSSNARMVLNEMVYDPSGSNNSSLLSLVAGTITFVAGETAKHGDMKVDTPVATMGIRGTAVLVEIDFTVSGQTGTPDAKFQVLVEPDGTTGSYILFDKSTLQPLAMVNQAGQQINISNGIISQSSEPLSPDVQKLINDVFSLKFSGLSNPKSTFAMNDSIVPGTYKGFQFELANGTLVQPIYASATGSNPSTSTSSSLAFLPHLDIPPTVTLSSGSLFNAGTRGSTAVDTVTGGVKFADVNAADLPTVHASFSSLILLDAQGNDITSTLTAQQLSAIELPLVLVADPANRNTGSVAWTYAIADTSFSFLKLNEILELTYTVAVETNYAPANSTVSLPLTITIVGPVSPTITATSGSISAQASVGSLIIDHTSGTISFADPDPTVHPAITAKFTSFTYQDASHHVIDSLTPEQQSDIAALELPLIVATSGSNSNSGSVGWSYAIADSKLDFLGAGETLTLIYRASIDDGLGGTASVPITVTIEGTEHVPTIAATSGSIVELLATNHAGIEQAGGSIIFSDASLTDHPTVSAQFTSFTYQDPSHHDITSSLTPQQQAEIAAIENSLVLTASDTNTNIGTVNWSYSVLDSQLAFLSPGATLTLIYTAKVDDGHGGIVGQPFTVSITDDLPAVVGSSDPPTQNVIIGPASTFTLAPGADTNSLGFHTETFDGQPSGSPFDNGAGTGNFFSAALDATFSSAGDAGIVNGTVEGVTDAPIVGPLPGQADATNYLSIGAGGSETIKFGSLENAFGLYWGSVDPFNQIDFYNGATLVASFGGGEINQLLSDNPGQFASNGFVQFVGLQSFNEVVLTTGNANSFEVDNISAGAIHSQLASPIGGTVTVDDPVAGDVLTGAVTEDAAVEYNGSTSLPSGADINALITASAIKFDSVISDGGSDIVEWTYQPVNANLDFLKPGDTLSITYTAQITDGNIAIGSHPLTINIVGTDPNTNMSSLSVVSGTSQNETFNNIGNGVTIFGGGGQDTFNFKAGFGSATIGDFNVAADAVNIAHSLFGSVAEILASAQAVDAGSDTIIVDSAHDQIKFIGVTVAQIQAHPGDFHLV